MKPSTILSAAGMAAMILAVGCGQPPPFSAEAPVEPKETAPAPPPPPKPIQLAQLSPVVLLPGGKAVVELQVERNDHKGPVQVQVDAVPEGISATAEEIPEGESNGQLQLSAAASLGEGDLVATLPVTVKVGQMQAEQALRLSVPAVKLPSFRPASGVLLQPGTSRTVDLAVLRNGYQGPLALRVEGAPAKVACKVAAVAADGNSTKLELTAARDAPNGQHKIRVAATLYGRSVGVEVPLEVDTQPYRVDSFRAVVLEPGLTERIEIPIQRKSYKGPIQLTAEGLPEGVTVKKVDVAAGQTKATLEATAAGDATQRVKSCRLAATAGHLASTGPIVIRISRGDDTYLPPGIAANPEVAPLLRRGSIGGRLTAESKQALLDFYGGTPESEAAVMRGLKWLAAHQQEDGSWPLNEYSRDIESCDCKTEFEEKIDEGDTAGTAFGVLPFLGAGVTHNRAPNDPPELAEYKTVVEKGLTFLAKNQVRGKDRNDKNDGNLGGNMYAHALGTIAFCEAYGLSGDERLKYHAQLSIKYLLTAQHTKGGGWRYSSGQVGDMSVTGWVFLAIRSAQLAGLVVDRAPLIRAERFVDSCAVGPSEAKMSRYAYQPEQAEKLALTAAGLLTRQYLGWRKDEPDLLAGCQYLMEHLPPESGGNLGPIYYYYYATQVLHHMEGPNFDLWNHRMRQHLINRQEKEGHKAGSWNPQGADHGARGGRMYATSMALMTLQVYYRHLPMYRPIKRTAS